MFLNLRETVNIVQSEEDARVLEAFRAVRGRIKFGIL
jgi:hypothetical protein